MLRALVAALVVANLLFFGFGRGWFDGWFGLSADGDREPERLSRQVRPERIVVVPAAAAAARAASAAGVCAGAADDPACIASRPAR